MDNILTLTWEWIPYQNCVDSRIYTVYNTPVYENYTWKVPIHMSNMIRVWEVIIHIIVPDIRNPMYITPLAAPISSLPPPAHTINPCIWFILCCKLVVVPWWCHQMETFSASLALFVGNSPVTGEFPTQGPVTRSFDVFFDPHWNKWLSKQSWGWWFATPLCSLWRQYNALYPYFPLSL